MTPTRAVALAIAALEREIKRLAVDANLHERFGVDTPHAVEASRRRAEARAAIAVLRSLEPKQMEMKL